VSVVARQKLRLVTSGPETAQEPSDEELAEAIARSDRKLGDLLYRRLIRTVDGTLFRTLGHRDPQHDDLVQAAFVQIVTTLSKRRFAGACSLKAWAGAITCRVALNTIRSRRVENRVLDRSPEGVQLASTRLDDENPDELVQLRRQMDLVRSLLGAMSPERAEAVLLHDMLGHELSEMAVLLGTSVAAAQSRLVRGRRELQQRMLERAASAKGGT